MRTVIALLCTLTCAAVFVAGCLDSGAGPELPPNPDFRDRTSPKNVIYNLELAYEQMNADEYLACLSEDFKFHFSEADQRGPDPMPPWFYKSDEQQVHENMFGDEWNVRSIDLTVTLVETMTVDDLRLLTDDIVVIHAVTDLMVNLEDQMFLATNPQDLYFRTVPDSEERCGRTHWEIFEWHDLECPWKDNGRHKTGWGRIKHQFIESLSEPSRRTSPAEVIYQLKAAYVALDTLNYLDCLSEDFIFYPCEEDMQNPADPLPEEWYRRDEAAMHENMFAGPDAVESITLSLTDVVVECNPGDPGDPLDDIWIYVEGVDLLVNLYGDQGYLATAPSEFRLRVDQDEEGPYGEIMWEIYQWYDLDSERGGEGADGRENTTWGGIKALFW